MESIPKHNRLPLNVKKEQPLSESGESDVRKIEAVSSADKTENIVMKENRRHDFASDEEMQRSKKYYDFLKSFPKFGKFVPSTLYFKARMTDDSAPRAYSIQQAINGRTIDKISDDELYSDPELVAQLLEFVDGAIDIIAHTRGEKKIKPDFGKSADPLAGGTFADQFKFNPRRSNNIMIADKSDESGQRVFFVDTGENIGERTGKLKEILQRQVIGRLQERDLQAWKRQLETLTD